MNRIALCIGNDSYSHLPPLSCAVQDATAMADKLRKLGFDTQLILNQTRADLLNNVFNFTAKIDDSDAAVIYYAGHGFQVEGDNLLAPTDLNIANPVKQVLLDALPLECLMHELNKYPDKPKVIILDACRDFLRIEAHLRALRLCWCREEQSLLFLHLRGNLQKKIQVRDTDITLKRYLNT